MSTKSTSEKIAQSARGEDKPLDAKRPMAPFTLVLGTFPILLVVALLALLFIFWLLRSPAAV